MAALKEQHEMQEQQLLAETQAKLARYQTKLDGESQHFQQLQDLHKSVAEHEQQKANMLQEFATFKKQREEHERRLTSEHSERLRDLSEEVSQAKRQFEAKLEEMEALHGQWTTEKDGELRSLEERHRKELLELRQSQLSQTENLEATKKDIELQYISKLEELNNEIERLKSDKSSLVEEYEQKLTKAQAFYNKELEAIRNTQSSSHAEELSQLREQMNKLKKDSQFEESRSKQRIESLLGELSVREEEIRQYKQEAEALKQTLSNTDSQSSFLNQQVIYSKQNENPILFSRYNTLATIFQ